MEIRYLNENDDLFEISSIYENSWKYTYRGMIPQEYLDSIPSGRWAERIQKNGMKNLVMTENGKIIATAGFCRSRWEKYTDYGEIVSIYFLPEYIGKGCGRCLLEACMRELSMLGFNHVLLWVLDENRRARRFYEKNGFIPTDEYLDNIIGGKTIREIMYIRKFK
jgi:ribosomal protein S18 acetylase RimI-like enzyme